MRTVKSNRFIFIFFLFFTICCKWVRKFNILAKIWNNCCTRWDTFADITNLENKINFIKLNSTTSTSQTYKTYMGHGLARRMRWYTYSFKIFLLSMWHHIVWMNKFYLNITDDVVDFYIWAKVILFIVKLSKV